MPQIRECVVELSQLLSRVSGQGLNQVGFLPPAQRASVQLDADGILQPLMDFLHGRYRNVLAAAEASLRYCKFHAICNVTSHSKLFHNVISWL